MVVLRIEARLPFGQALLLNLQRRLTARNLSRSAFQPRIEIAIERAEQSARSGEARFTEELIERGGVRRQRLVDLASIECERAVARRLDAAIDQRQAAELLPDERAQAAAQRAHAGIGRKCPRGSTAVRADLRQAVE